MLGRKALLGFVVNVVGAVGGAIALLAIGRFMGPEPYGMVGFGLAAVTLGAMVGRMGLDHAHVKRVSEGRLLPAAMATHLWLRSGAILAYATLFFAGVWWWNRYQGFYDATSAVVLLAAGGVFFLQEIREMLLSTFRGLQQAARTQAAVLAEHVIRLPAVVAVALLYGASRGEWLPGGAAFGGWLKEMAGPVPWSQEHGATLILAAYALSVLGSLLLTVGLLARFGLRPGRFDKAMASDYWRFARPLALVGVIGTLSLAVDRVMLGYFWSATEVGYYYGAQRLISFILIIPTLVGGIFFPLISEMASRGGRDLVIPVARSTHRLVGILIIGSALPFLAFPRQLLHILVGDGFLPAAPVVRLLAVYVVVNGLGLVDRSVMQGFDRPSVLAKLAVITTVLNLVLNTVLIPTSILGVPLAGLRAPGAAMATLAAGVLGFLLVSVATRREVGAWLLHRGVVKQLVAGAIAVAAMALPAVRAAFGGIDRVWELLAACLALGLLYLAGLAALRQVGRHEVAQAMDLVHPSRMLDYVRDEMRAAPGAPPEPPKGRA